ncbi:MAG: ribbon-helix-helix protein, CopG family [Patescibacteria group bacterium]
MLKNSKLLTVTVPKATYTRIRSEAKKRRTSISGLVRDAFESYAGKPAGLEEDLRSAVREEILQLKTFLLPAISQEEQKDIEKRYGTPKRVSVKQARYSL